jgi:hypothetical protein
MHEAPRAAPQLYEGEGEEMMHDVCAWGYEMSWVHPTSSYPTPGRLAC